MNPLIFKKMLTIIYRCCGLELDVPPKRVGRPHWFSKFACFQSLHQSLKNSKYLNDINVLVIVDGGKCALSRYIEDLGYKVEYIYANSNLGSLKVQLDLSRREKGNIYFLEDDYLHTLDAIDNIYLGVMKFGLITGYDHTDRYTRTDDISYEQNIYLSGNRHWRATESTTCTFSIRRDLLDSCYPLLESVFTQAMDRVLFRELHKYNYRLFSAMPALSTHADANHLSPFVDWESISRANMIKIRMD